MYYGEVNDSRSTVAIGVSNTLATTTATISLIVPFNGLDFQQSQSTRCPQVCGLMLLLSLKLSNRGERVTSRPAPSRLGAA